MPFRFSLLLLLLLLPLVLRAQSQDELTKRSLSLFDLPPFEWAGEPEPMSPRLGLYTNPLPKDSLKDVRKLPASIDRGWRIWHIMPHWSADDGGLFIGDIILMMNGKPIGDSVFQGDEYMATEAKRTPDGTPVRFTIARDNKVMEVSFTLKRGVRTPMPYHGFDALGGTNFNSWLNLFIRQNNLVEWTQTIQKQMRNVADQDFCTVQFAGRPNPWRLNVVTYLHHHPTRVGAVSRFISNELWNWVDRAGLQGAIIGGAATIDVNLSYMTLKNPPTTREAIDEVMRKTQSELDAGYAPVRDDLESMRNDLVRLLNVEDDEEVNLDSINDRVERRNRRNAIESKRAILFGKIDRVDLKRILQAATDLAILADSGWLTGNAESIAGTGATQPVPLVGVEGEVVAAWRTPQGLVVIGGRGVNHYSADIRFLIDLGGNDIYDLPQIPAGTFRFVADLQGDDIYRSDSSGEGAGICGIDLLIDLRGNDIYRGVRWSQGAGILGVGALVDYSGDDIYTSRWCSQGSAMHGVGILLDRNGSDRYDAEIYAQAFAYTHGFGTILDEGGNDSYRAGWKYLDDRIPHRAYLAMSQGFGFGMRPWTTGIGTDGGVGLLADRHGDDLYSSDFFSQGGSYWYSLGILHDMEGSDRYTAGQYSQGSGIHLSFAALLDDAGDDTYDAYAGLEQGNSHDWSSGCLEDAAGNDTYRGSNSSQGSALTVAFAWLLDGDGNDQYYAMLSDTSQSQGGGREAKVREAGSLGMLIDLGKGKDYYVDRRVEPGHELIKGYKGIVWDDGE